MSAAQGEHKHAALTAHALTSPNKHMPGLDVIRGLAILGVLVFHGFIPTIELLESRFPLHSYPVLHVARYGYLGVHLFFVLSGFLITGILLDTRNNSDYYKTFYMRRILRIVPAYLLMIVILRSTDQISWLFVLMSMLYLVNMSTSFIENHGYSVFWSLSVEEQFYLVWPVCIRRLRVRHSFYLALLLLFGVPVLRFGLQSTKHFDDIYFKVWSLADFFGGGAAIAMLIRSSRVKPYLWHICLSTFVASAISFAAWLLSSGATSLWSVRAVKATALTPWALFFSSVVLFGYLVPSIAAIPFLSKFLTFLGYISYGLYLCHPLIQRVVEAHWQIATLSGNPLLGMLLARFIVTMGAAIAIAYLSRRTFENYFLKLKPRQREVVHDLRLVQ